MAARDEIIKAFSESVPEGTADVADKLIELYGESKDATKTLEQFVEFLAGVGADEELLDTFREMVPTLIEAHLAEKPMKSLSGLKFAKKTETTSGSSSDSNDESNNGKKKKKPRKKQEEVFPSKSGQYLFYLRVQDEVEKDISSKDVTATRARVTEMWNALSESERDDLNEKAKLPRWNGYHLHYHEQKEIIENALKEEHERDTPDKEYVKNQAVIQNRCSKRWEGLTDEERQEYNDKAEQRLRDLGITPKHKAPKEPKAINAHKMFIKEKYAERREQAEGDREKSDEAMKHFNEEWKALNDEQRKTYQELADRYNDEHGLKTKFGKGGDPNNKTGKRVTRFHMFDKEFRAKYEAEHPDEKFVYADYKVIRGQRWKAINDNSDTSELDKYEQMARTECRARGIPIQGE